MRRLRAWLVAVAIMAAGLHAGAAGLQPELDTSTPRAAYLSFVGDLTHLNAIYHAYMAAPGLKTQYAVFSAVERLGSRFFDLSAVTPATRVKAAAVAVAYMSDILLRLPPIPPEQIPGTPPLAANELPTTWTIPGTEIRMRRLTEGPFAGNYAFTADTLARLPEFHAAIIDQPPLRAGPHDITQWRDLQLRFTGSWLARLPLASLPAPLQIIVLGTPLWKALLAAMVILLVYAGVTRSGHLVRRLAAGQADWRWPAIWLMMPALLAAVVLIGTFVIAWQIELIGPLFDTVVVLGTIVLYVAAAWAAWLAIHLCVELIVALPTIPDQSYDANLLRLLARVASVIAVVMLLMHGASQVGVPALSLLAGVSVGGIALALAAQSTVENLFGGISIFADRPFRVGDIIHGATVSGTVERVGPRSSRIRGADGTLTTVPNSDLAKMVITNMTARNNFLFRHLVRLGGETPRREIEGLLAELRRRVEAEPRVRKAPGLPRVRLVGFGDSSIDIEVFAPVPVATQAEFLEVQEKLMLDIMNAVEGAGLRFAFAAQPAVPESIQAHA